jgi:hypothetical protein
MNVEVPADFLAAPVNASLAGLFGRAFPLDRKVPDDISAAVGRLGPMRGGLPNSIR